MSEDWPSIDFDITPYLPTWRERVAQRLREWWCAKFGHDYHGGAGFNGDYVVHWYQCRRCGDGGSD